MPCSEPVKSGEVFIMIIFLQNTWLHFLLRKWTNPWKNTSGIHAFRKNVRHLPISCVSHVFFLITFYIIYCAGVVRKLTLINFEQFCSLPQDQKNRIQLWALVVFKHLCKILKSGFSFWRSESSILHHCSEPSLQLDRMLLTFPLTRMCHFNPKF